MRTFVAVNLPDARKDQMQYIQNSIKPYTKRARFTRRANLHLTLKFLGELDSKGKEKAIKAIEKACVHTKSFEVTFDKLVYFGKEDNMKVMWIGMKHADNLLSLQRNIEERFTESGFQPDNKGFKPHITIGRDVSLSDKDLSAFSIYLDKLYIDKIYLMRSENKGKGYFYTPIYQFDLLR